MWMPAYSNENAPNRRPVFEIALSLSARRERQIGHAKVQKRAKRHLMRLRLQSSVLLLLGALLLPCCCFSTNGRAAFWVSAYYAGYHQRDLPPEDIDFQALTHVIHFAVVPKANGMLDADINLLTPSNCTNLVTQAHAAGRKVLISVGGAGTVSAFRSATAPATLAFFITNLTNFLALFNYDGIDIDWEPLATADTNQFMSFVLALRAALDQFPTEKLLTAAVEAYPAPGVLPMFANLQSRFDQINVMTYVLSGPYPGWITWFTGSIFDGDLYFPGTTRLVPSANGAITNFIGHGISRGKLAIGIYFSGDVWFGGDGTANGGVAFPRQSWSKQPTVSNISYHEVMDLFFQNNRYRWDDAAQAAYLTIDNPGTNDMFISYEDEHTCQVKVAYARNQYLGGVMIFELGNGYRTNQPVGRRDLLLQAVKQSVDTPRFIGIRRNAQDIVLNFSTLPASFYRISWKNDLTSQVWNTLSNTVPGSGGTVSVSDSGGASNSSRFYRVQTPP